MGQAVAKALPPHDLAAEQGCLAACLAHGAEVIGGLVDTLQERDFFDQRHAAIWQALVMLWDRGEPIDEISLGGYLRDQGRLDMVGGPLYLADLGDMALAPLHGEHYARMVRDKAALRDLEGVAHDILRQTRGAGEPSAVLALAQDGINRLATGVGASNGGAVACSQTVPMVLDELEQRQAQGHDPQATPFGFEALDAATGGMLPSELVTLAGATSMGKTSLALGIAANVAVRQHRPVLFVSKEQNIRQLTGWFLCRECKADTLRWRTGRLTDWERHVLRAERERLAATPLHWLALGETGEQAIRSIGAEARRLQGRGGLALVVVDYLQLFARSEDNKDIAVVSKGLKGLATRLDVPVLSLSQFSRAIDHRDRKGHLPVLSDLRGSGSIEQDSDGVLFAYRPAYYDPQFPDKTLAVVLPAKFRGGARGAEAQVKLRFLPQFVRFEDESEAEGQKGMF